MEEEEDSLPDVVRPAEEVAKRSLALFAAVGCAIGAPRQEIATWLTQNELWSVLTEAEVRFLSAEQADQRDRINFSWQSERLMVLLWSLNKVEELPPATEQCDTSVFQDILPPYAPTDVSQFIGGAKLRSDDELIDMADTLLDLHWHARDGKINNRPPRKPVDIEIIQERHHAMNWVIGYRALSWDEVTTDT